MYLFPFMVNDIRGLAPPKNPASSDPLSLHSGHKGLPKMEAVGRKVRDLGDLATLSLGTDGATVRLPMKFLSHYSSVLKDIRDINDSQSSMDDAVWHHCKNCCGRIYFVNCYTYANSNRT